MAVKGFPILIVESGGAPVRPMDSGYPLMTVSENVHGLPITISDLGAPFVVDGYDPLGMFALSTDEGENLTDDDSGIMETYVGNTTS